MPDRVNPTWMDEDYSDVAFEVVYDGPHCEDCNVKGQIHGTQQLTDDQQLQTVELDLGEVWLYECGSNPCRVLCVTCAEARRDER